MALGRPLTARGGPPLVAHVCPFPGSCSFPGVAGPLGPPPCPTGLAPPAAARGSQRPNRVRSRRRRWYLGKRAGSRRRHGHEGGPLWRNVLGARPPESHAHSGTGRGRLGRSRNVAGGAAPGSLPPPRVGEGGSSGAPGMGILPPSRQFAQVRPPPFLERTGHARSSASSVIGTSTRRPLLSHFRNHVWCSVCPREGQRFAPVPSRSPC